MFGVGEIGYRYYIGLYTFHVLYILLSMYKNRSVLANRSPIGRSAVSYLYLLILMEESIARYADKERLLMPADKQSGIETSQDEQRYQWSVCECH